MAIEINKFSNDASGGGNTGSERIPADTLTGISRILIMPLGSSFASKTLAETLSVRKSACIADKSVRHFLFPKADKLSDKTTDPVKVKSDYKGERILNDGILAFDLECSGENVVVLKKLRTFSKGIYLCSFFDENGNEVMTSPDGIKVQGFKCYVYVSPRKFATASSLGTYTISVVLQNTPEWADRAVYLNPVGWSVDDLPVVYDTELRQIGKVSSTKMTVGVQIDAIKTTDSDGQILGLQTTDFAHKTSAGVNSAITHVSDNGDGTYELTGTFAVNDTVTLVPCDTISLVDINTEASNILTIASIS